MDADTALIQDYAAVNRRFAWRLRVRRYAAVSAAVMAS